MAHHRTHDLVLVLAAVVLVAYTTSISNNFHAQATASTATKPSKAAVAAISASQEEFLDAHNGARAEVGVGPLMWSQMLANMTSRLVRYQRDKMGCQFANLTTGSKYGGNQLWASGQTVAPRDAVQEWIKEKAFYNHTDNSCSPPDHQCGVYTQVVWKKSQELGCAQASCVKDSTSLTICFYSPPGNVIGESPY